MNNYDDILYTDDLGQEPCFVFESEIPEAETALIQEYGEDFSDLTWDTWSVGDEPDDWWERKSDGNGFHTFGGSRVVQELGRRLVAAGKCPPFDYEEGEE